MREGIRGDRGGRNITKHQEPYYYSNKSSMQNLHALILLEGVETLLGTSHTIRLNHYCNTSPCTYIAGVISECIRASNLEVAMGD